MDEHIFHMAGAQTPQLTAQAERRKATRETGREPVPQDTFYQPVQPEEVPAGTAYRPPSNPR